MLNGAELMSEKDGKSTNIKVNKWIVAFVVSIVLIPILINSSLFLRYPPTPSDLGNADWLTFWGNFIGGSIGGISTLIAISYTLNQNSKYHKELMVNQADSNKEIVENQNEMKRVDVMPYLNFVVEEDNYCKLAVLNFPNTYIIFDDVIFNTTKLSDQYKKMINDAEKNDGIENTGNKFMKTIELLQQTVEICNLGLGTAVNVIVDLCSEDGSVIKKMLIPLINIVNNKPIKWRLLFCNKFNNGTYFIKFSMMDIQCKYFYEQKIKFIYSSENFSYENIMKPVLIKEIIVLDLKYKSISNLVNDFFTITFI